MGIALKRSVPKLKKSFYKTLKNRKITHSNRSVYLYLDEFTNYNDTEIGADALTLLEGLGYQVHMLPPRKVDVPIFPKVF